ncbi:MAG: FtsX-like permease family protein [Bacilli bacterium]
MKNNNNKILFKLVKRNMRNRTKSLFMLISIILISFMLFTIFSVGFSYYDNYQIMNTRLQGSTANASFTNPTLEQLEKINQLDYIDVYGLQVFCGEITSDNLQSDESIVMTNYSEDEWNNNILPTISNFNGKYPSKENEILMSQWTLNKLGISNPEVGMKIPLIYSSNKTEKKDFILSGFYEDYLLGLNGNTKSANVASEIFYFQKEGKIFNILGNSIVSDSFAQNNGVGNSQAVMLSLKNKNVDAKELLKDLKQDLSINIEQKLLTFGVSDKSSSGFQFILASSLIALIVLLSGYFLINNIMRISVVKDIHYYGQLKTLGATKKQLKSLVKKQVLFYGILGIPIGIFVAGLTSIYIIPTIIESIVNNSSIENILPTETSFNYLIFIFTILFAFITLWMSCIRPAKMAGKISPINALKYNVFMEKKYRVNRKKAKHGGKIYKLAFRNVFSDRKKALSVYFSLFIGLLSFLTIYTAFSTPDFSIRFEKEQPYTFDVTINNDSNSENFITKDEFAQVSSIKEIENVIPVYTDITQIRPDINVLDKDIKDKLDYYDKNLSYYETNSDQYQATLVVLNKEQIDTFEKVRKDVDYESFFNGNAVILLNDSASKENIGKSISLLNKTKNKDEKFEILNLFTQSEKFRNNAEDFYMDDTDNVYVFVSQSGIERLDLIPTIKALKINSKRSNDDVIESSLDNIFSENDFNIDSQKGTERTLMPMIESMMFGGMCFAFILVIIGIMNYINVIVTNMNSRQKELSVLEAVGMTKYQLKKLIIYESLYYVLISLLLLMTVGLALTKTLVTIVHKAMYYFTFNIPIFAIIAISIVLILICIFTSLTIYISISKKSISERLNISVD